MPLETVHKPFGQLYFAAKRLARLSEQAAEDRRQREDEIALAQSEILLLVFALECLINQVIADLAPISETRKRRVMRISLTEKYAYVPYCGAARCRTTPTASRSRALRRW